MAQRKVHAEVFNALNIYIEGWILDNTEVHLLVDINSFIWHFCKTLRIQIWNTLPVKGTLMQIWKSANMFVFT